MRLGDLVFLLFETLRTQRLRSLLTMLGIVIGIGAVVLLSSIGEGARTAVLAQFTQFGTDIVGVQPGRQKSFGVGPGSFGGTTRPLTLGDARALGHIAGAAAVAPHVAGTAQLDASGRTRHTYVYGTTGEDAAILQVRVRTGAFLPTGDPEAAPSVCVLGPKTARELFPGESPLGMHLRIGDARFTVIGVVREKGQVLGFDLDDIVYIPVARAIKLFNRDALTEIHVLAINHARVPGLVAEIERVLKERHADKIDFTVNTQKDMLDLVDEVLTVMTSGVLLIAAISVIVGAIGIATILWVSVHERTSEIGLVKAIGASDGQVVLLFLAESGALSLAGGMVGVAGAWLLGDLVHVVAPSVPLSTPLWIIPIALGASLVVGILAGVLPARRAATLDPVEALRAE